MYSYTKDNKAQLRMPAIINGRCMNGLTKKGDICFVCVVLQYKLRSQLKAPLEIIISIWD